MPTSYPGLTEMPRLSAAAAVRSRTKLIMIGATLMLGATACGGDGGGDSASEEDTITMGAVPWLGYAPWAVADEEGCFTDEGLTVEFTSYDTDPAPIFSAGQMDVVNTWPPAIPAVQDSGMAAKAVLLLDASLTADAILGGPGVTSMADLRGKKVAYEEGSTSDLLLQWELERDGMSIDDVEAVPMGADAAMTALQSGKVDVAVTYEPYITLAKAAGADFTTIATAEDNPGLISDVLLVPQAMIDDNPDQVQGLVNSWSCAMDFINTNQDEGMQIMADWLGASVEDITPSYEGVTLYDGSQQSELSGAFSTDVLPGIIDASIAAGLIEKNYEASDLIDPQFADQVAGK